VEKNISGPFAFYRTARTGVIPAGIGSPFKDTTIERIEGDEKTALEQLRKTLNDFEKFEGMLSTHFRFGPLSKQKWIHFHAMHLANHLGHAKLDEIAKEP